VVGGQAINGLDPETGAPLWSHPHDTSGDMNNTMPVWGDDQVLIVTSAYNGGTRALRLSRGDAGTEVEELWFTSRLRTCATADPRGEALRRVICRSGDILAACTPKTGQLPTAARAARAPTQAGFEPATLPSTA
jgi:hypothetical protein